MGRSSAEPRRESDGRHAHRLSGRACHRSAAGGRSPPGALLSRPDAAQVKQKPEEHEHGSGAEDEHRQPRRPLHHRVPRSSRHPPAVAREGAAKVSARARNGSSARTGAREGAGKGTRDLFGAIGLRVRAVVMCRERAVNASLSRAGARAARARKGGRKGTRDLFGAMRSRVLAAALRHVVTLIARPSPAAIPPRRPAPRPEGRRARRTRATPRTSRRATPSTPPPRHTRR